MELREIVARAAFKHEWRGNADWATECEVGSSSEEYWLTCADAILAAIAEAGLVIIPKKPPKTATDGTAPSIVKP